MFKVTNDANKKREIFYTRTFSFAAVLVSLLLTNVEYVQHINVVFFSLTLNMKLPAS